MPDKILSYIGFALKARKIKMGVNACNTLKGRVPVFILCQSASPNTQKDAIALAKKHGSKIILSINSLENIVGKQNCKLIAITDNQLSKAILNNLNEHFVILEAEN